MERTSIEYDIGGARGDAWRKIAEPPRTSEEAWRKITLAIEQISAADRDRTWKKTAEAPPTRAQVWHKILANPLQGTKPRLEEHGNDSSVRAAIRASLRKAVGVGS
jgi:hypothetical protein